MSKLDFNSRNDIKINFLKKFNTSNLTNREKSFINSYPTLFYKIIKNTLSDEKFLNRCGNKLGKKKFQIYIRTYPKFLQEGAQFKTVNTELNLLNYEKIKNLIDNDIIENLKDEFYRPIFKILKEVNNELIEYTIEQLLLYEESQAEKGTINIKDLNIKEKLDEKIKEINDLTKELAIFKNEKEKSIIIIKKLNKEKTELLEGKTELLEENREINRENRKLTKENKELKKKIDNNNLFKL